MMRLGEGEKLVARKENIKNAGNTTFQKVEGKRSLGKT
jgi:hypothetical protein